MVVSQVWWTKDNKNIRTSSGSRIRTSSDQKRYKSMEHHHRNPSHVYRLKIKVYIYIYQNYRIKWLYLVNLIQLLLYNWYCALFFRHFVRVTLAYIAVPYSTMKRKCRKNKRFRFPVSNNILNGFLLYKNK